MIENINFEDDEQISSSGAICPYCGYVHEPDGDNYELYQEGETIITCDHCDKDFKSDLYISYTWTTTKIEDEDEI